MKSELFSSKTMLSAGVAGAAVTSPAFAAMDLEPGFETAAGDEALLVAEGACGEGTCGGSSSGGEEGSCGEGACGEGNGGEEGSCGEGACGESGGGEEGACGEGACGGG